MKPISIGEKLRQLRFNRKLSQKQLAEALFVQHTTISNWEKDLRKINLDQLQQIATFFEVDLSYFQSETAIPPQATKKSTTNRWIAASAVGSILLSTTALILVNRINPIPIASCYGQENCEYINDPSIVNELSERSITGGIMTNVELSLVYSLMSEHAWIEHESLNTLSNKKYVERVLDTLNTDFGVYSSSTHDAMYQYFLNPLTIQMYTYLDFESINTENKQLIIRDNTKYVLYKTGDDVFSYEVFDPEFVYRYTLDLSLNSIYSQEKRLVANVETLIKNLMSTSYQRTIEDSTFLFYFKNIPTEKYMYYFTYRSEKLYDAVLYELFAYNKETNEVFIFESYFSSQQITFHLMTQDDFFFYPFSADELYSFDQLLTIIPNLEVDTINPSFIEGGLSFSAFQSLFITHFSDAPYEDIAITVSTF